MCSKKTYTKIIDTKSKRYFMFFDINPMVRAKKLTTTEIVNTIVSHSRINFSDKKFTFKVNHIRNGLLNIQAYKKYSGMKIIVAYWYFIHNDQEGEWHYDHGHKIDEFNRFCKIYFKQFE